MEIAQYITFGTWGFYILIASVIFVIWGGTFLYHLFRKKRKLHDMAPTNKNFKIDQGKEVTDKEKED